MRASWRRRGGHVIPVTLVALLVLMALAIPVAASMGVLALFLEAVYSQLPLVRAMGEVAWSASNEFLLVSVPLFILLGEILLRSGFAERMYGSLIHWVSWLPGGLMHSNIAACAMFAATSGSSVATAATVGTVALPQARRFGYNERLFLGTLAAGGTLGILIPPSINMIVYAVLTNTSVPKLYLAGMIPGLVLCGLFMLTVVLLCWARPSWGGKRMGATWGQRFAGLVHLLPPLGIFVVVVGSIYAGVATPTEAASLGVVAALGLAWWKGRLTLGDAARGSRGHDALHRHGDADLRRRLLPQLRHFGDRPYHPADELHRAVSVSRRAGCWWR